MSFVFLPDSVVYQKILTGAASRMMIKAVLALICRHAAITRFACAGVFLRMEQLDISSSALYPLSTYFDLFTKFLMGKMNGADLA
jgi:hypothetical protein